MSTNPGEDQTLSGPHPGSRPAALVWTGGIGRRREAIVADIALAGTRLFESTVLVSQAFAGAVQFCIEVNALGKAMLVGACLTLGAAPKSAGEAGKIPRA